MESTPECFWKTKDEASASRSQEVRVPHKTSFVAVLPRLLLFDSHFLMALESSETDRRCHVGREVAK